MATLLSPTDCYYCRSNTNIQRYKLPCNCLLYAHPDCYVDSIFKQREHINGEWKMRCQTCNSLFNMPKYSSLQIIIPHDDEEMLPLTRKEMKREKCKICTILSVQGVVIAGALGFIIWGYAKIIMGII